MDTSSAYDADGYLKTGDLVYYDDDECFYVKDRLKEIFKYRGWHILPAMLEEILLNHPAVKEAAVVGIPHELDGGHPMGFVVLLDGFDDVTAEEIGTFFEKQVSDCQKLRAGLRIVEEIPRTATGKIMRRVIKEMVLNNESAYTGIEEVVPKKLFWKSDYVELSAREF
ncbi:hypothetical protein JTB14_028824 [Gonioctena quinquepunctata]|nr:hypothetical protein JTB14_028824 [Gonioctena quinquepunctata]